MDLLAFRRTAAEIAAAAVFELFPDVELWGGSETPTGFAYDFYFPHPIHPETLPMIEERMRQIIRERRPIRTLDMVPFSARELLKKEGHFIRAEELDGEDLVEVIQIGDFTDLCPGPHLKNTAEAAAFKINSVEVLPDRGMRLTGYVHTSKDSLKHFLKKLSQYRSPEKIGEARGYWVQSPYGLIWKRAGIEAKAKLVQTLKEQLCVGAMEVSCPQGDRDAMHAWLGREKVSEQWGEWLQISVYSNNLEFSLQSVAKTLTILGFTASMSPLGRETEFWIEDGIERRWPVVQVKKDEARVVILVDVEKIFALLLEMMVTLENQ